MRKREIKGVSDAVAEVAGDPQSGWGPVGGSESAVGDGGNPLPGGRVGCTVVKHRPREHKSCSTCGTCGAQFG